MIFSAKNEKDIPTWELVLTDQKTVTRRMKPEPVGAIRSVQPGRCKKAVCKIRILRCEPHFEAYDRIVAEAVKKTKRISTKTLGDFIGGCFSLTMELLNEEAKREGFRSYLGLYLWFHTHKIDIEKTYRIEFERINET
jgi:hypothetical protein